MPHLGSLRSLSSLLRAAVADAQEIEQQAGYRLAMGDWHRPWRGLGVDAAVCEVCLAGAVMARRLGADPKRRTNPYEFPMRTRDKLYAIDRMRNGRFGEAYDRVYPADTWHGSTPAHRRAMGEARQVVVLGFRDGSPGRASWPTYLQAADLLARAGL